MQSPNNIIPLIQGSEQSGFRFYTFLEWI